MNLKRVVSLVGQRIPEQLAIVEGTRRLTYAEWLADVYAFANSLQEIGVGRGDRVAIAMRNTIDHATVTVATAVVGAVGVPFNYRSKPLTVHQILADSGAVALVYDDPELPVRLERAGNSQDRLLWIVAAGGASPSALVLREMIAAGEGTEPSNDPAESDLCHILYTSGTTGEPKGVPHTHGNVYERMQGWLMHFGPPMSTDVRTLGISPLYHIAGLHCVYWVTVLLNGAYFPVSEFVPERILALTEKERLTYAVGSPVIFDSILDNPEAESFDLTSVRDVVFASAPRPPHLVGRLQKHFPNARLAEAYGTGEGVMMGSVDVVNRPGAFLCVGDLEARVIRPGGRPDELTEDGDEGELIVSTNSGRMVDYYWERPDLTAEKVRDGWSYTGDAFIRDAEGNLFVGGRLDDMFISGGENIQPVEVEIVLARHPGIRDVAVIGTPHARWGEVCTAFVVPSDPGLSADDIDRFCKESPDLADFKRPRRVFFVDEISRNATGKILRKELRKLYLEGALSAS